MKRSSKFRPQGIFVLSLLALLVLTGASTLSRPQVAEAHPLGNFTINRYARIEPGVDQIHLRYVLDLAEIPTFQEMPKIDLNRDGTVSTGENESYLANKVEELRGRMQLSVNGSEVPLDPVAQELSFPPGQSGLSTMRLSLLLRGQLEGSVGPEE